MAVTATQKAEFLEGLGKPKSLHYFATAPNLGPDWSWSKALAGGYSQAEIDDFIGKAETAYKAHKTKSKATPADKGVDGPGPTPSVVGQSCAKSAVKSLAEISDGIKDSMQLAYHSVWKLKNASMLGPDDVYDHLPSLRKLLASEVDEFAAAVGEAAPEVIAGRTMIEVLDLLSDMKDAQKLTALPNDAANLKVYLNLRKKMHGRRLKIFQNQASLNPPLNNYSLTAGNDIGQAVATWVGDVDTVVAARFQQQFFQIPGAQQALSDAFDLTQLEIILPNQAIKGLADLNDAVAGWLNSTNGIFDSLDDLGNLSVVEGMKARAATISQKVSVGLGDAHDVDWWKGGITISDDAPIKVYPNFADFSSDLATTEDVLATANELGLGVAKKKFSADAMSEAFDAHMTAAADLIEEIPVPAPDITAEVIDSAVSQLIADADTDQLNPMVKKLLESDGETPSLTYFMSKAQKQDYLTNKTKFFTTNYEIKYKGQVIEGPGLDTAKAKYAMKNGQPAPTGSVHEAAGAKSIDEALAASTKTPPVSAGGTVPVTGEPVPLPADAPKWWADPHTEKQSWKLNNVITKEYDIGDQETILDALQDGGWYEALKAGNLTKGHMTLMIDKVIETADIDANDVKTILAYGKAQKVTDVLDEAFDAMDAQPGTANPVADVIDEIADGPVVSGAKPATGVAPENPVWDEPHNFTYVGDGQAKWGGAHRKWHFTDEAGNDWMLKHGADFRSEGELAAHRLGHLAGFDVAEARITSLPVSGRRQNGFLQRMYRKSDVVGELKGVMDAGSLRNVDAAVIRQVQEHQVLDWLIGNHDSHSSNFLILSDGRVVGVDKGQAFKFFGKDRLAHDYEPDGNFGEIVYNRMWREYREGTIDLDLDSISDALSRVESMSDDQVAEMVTRYATGRFGAPSSDAFLRGTSAGSAEELVELVLDRKRTIRKQFEDFYQEQARARGETWNPVWQKKVTRKIDRVKGDPLTPITDDFAQALERVGTNGKPIYVAGAEVERGQILFDLMQTPDGKRVLRANLTLRPAGDAKLMKLLKEQAGEAVYEGNSLPGIPQAITQTAQWANTTVSAAKTINHHVTSGDFQFNASTIQSARSLLNEIDVNPQMKKWVDQGWATPEVVEIHEKGAFDFDLRKVQQLIDSGADEAAIEAAITDEAVYRTTLRAKFGLRHDLERIITEAEKGTGASKVPHVAPFDGVGYFEKIKKQGFDEVERLRAGVKIDVPEPVKVFEEVRLADVTTSGVVKGGGNNPIGRYQQNWVSANGHGRIQYDISTTINGKKVKAAYRGIDARFPSMKGWFEIVMETGDQEVDAADVAAIHRWLTDDLGISAKMANETDMELLYWRMVQGNYKFSKSVQETTSSSYAKAVNLAEERLGALGPAPTPEQEIEAIRGAYRQVFGKVIDDADVLPIQNHMVSAEADEFGWGYWERPEISAGEMAEAGRGQLIYHNLGYNGSSFSEEFWGAATGQGLTGQQERWRYGYNAHAASASRDMEVGGATSLFSRTSTSVPTGDAMIISPHRRVRRLLDYAADHDSYGRLDVRGRSHRLEPDRMISIANSGEMMLRDMASFMDDGEIMFVTDSGVRNRWLAAYRERGVHTIRGVPIEERIVARGEVSPTDYARKFFQKYVNMGERLRVPAERFVQGARATAARVEEFVAGIPSRLKLKGKGGPGSPLSKKLSTGREQTVFFHKLDSPRITVRAHTVENAISVPKDLAESYWPWEAAKQPNYGTAGDAIVIDLSKWGIDLKNKPAYQRKYFVNQFVQALGEDEQTMNAVIQRAGGTV